MILQKKYLSILYYFNLVFITPSSAGCAYSSQPRRTNKSETTESLRRSDRKVNEIPSPVFINKVITNLIIDDVSRMFQNWIEEESSKRGEEINFLVHDQSEELTKFFIAKFFSGNTEDMLKLTFVTYVASEYFYSLLLCVIWNSTTEEADRDINFLDALKGEGDSVLKKCPDSLNIFLNLIKSYRIAIHKFKTIKNNKKSDEGCSRRNVNTEYNTENESKEGGSDEITEIVQSQKEFESASGRSFSEVVIELTHCIHNLKNIYKQIGNTIEKCKEDKRFSGKFIREFIVEMNENSVSSCLNDLRSYFDKSNINFGITHFGACTSHTEEDVTQISESEEQLWRNVVRILERNEAISYFDFLYKCEILRYGRIVYPNPFAGNMKYVYPKFSVTTLNNIFSVYTYST